jgi:hypothetical protein
MKKALALGILVAMATSMPALAKNWDNIPQVAEWPTIQHPYRVNTGKATYTHGTKTSKKRGVYPYSELRIWIHEKCGPDHYLRGTIDVTLRNLSNGQSWRKSAGFGTESFNWDRSANAWVVKFKQESDYLANNGRLDLTINGASSKCIYVEPAAEPTEQEVHDEAPGLFETLGEVIKKF